MTNDIDSFITKNHIKILESKIKYHGCLVRFFIIRFFNVNICHFLVIKTQKIKLVKKIEKELKILNNHRHGFDIESKIYLNEYSMDQ